MLRRVRRISGRSYTGPLFPRTSCCAFPLLARWWLHKDWVRILYKIRLWHGVLKKQQVWPTFLWPKNSRNPAKSSRLAAQATAPCALRGSLCIHSHWKYAPHGPINQSIYLSIHPSIDPWQSIDPTLGSLLKQTLSIVFVFNENDSRFYLVADVIWSVCFSQATELSSEGQKHWMEQNFT